MDGRTDLTEITPLDNSLDNSKYKMTNYAKFGLATFIGGSILGANFGKWKRIVLQ